ncbi:MAG: energy-coupling factor ABC transporter ATP-binding protein [Clostridia bacterium]|nr:energy-coupling factor ABC transporter ATP-binding protein [Clostridia bacterium]
MEQIICKNLNFSYPLSDENALDNINLSVRKGEFIVLCGRSGCGKTTLLRHMKAAVTPAGKRSGEILFCGKPLSEMNSRDAAMKIGFVMQDPDNQIVTDKVWHELAFGLENLGTESSVIRLKAAEMAAYFGMKDWFNKKISELSGGQKQLLNLASVMVMNPEVIIFDEPTSQLDPVAAGNFLATVSKINRELGITVIMTEHRLEEVFAYADRVLVMENGRITVDCTPKELTASIKNTSEFVRLSMPATVRIHSAVCENGESPLTVNEGARWISDFLKDKEIKFNRIIPKKFEDKGTALKIKNLFFRYDAKGADILENLSLEVPKGSIFAIMGGNGAGKSTLLKVVSGQLKAISGKIEIFGEKAVKSKAKILYLPQNVQTLFTRKTVLAELEEMGADKRKINEIAALTGIEKLLDRHPYDISGGEQQRLGLAKILLKEPEILLLDEPTKGMDCEFKAEFAKILEALKAEGKTVVMVSHDIEFCSVCADFCAMMFDSTVVSVKDSNGFFAGNFFYTTSANRMTRHVFENCVTDKDVISLCKKNILP